MTPQVENTESDIFSQRLALLMKSRPLLQSDLAAELGVSQAAVSRWLAGRVPRASELYRLAKLFGVSMESLLADVPDVEPTNAEIDTVPIGDVQANRLRLFCRQMGWTMDDFERFLGGLRALSPMLSKSPLAASTAAPLPAPVAPAAPVAPVAPVAPSPAPVAPAPAPEPRPPAAGPRARGPSAAAARREQRLKAAFDQIGEGALSELGSGRRPATAAKPAPIERPNRAARGDSVSELAPTNQECPPPAKT